MFESCVLFPVQDQGKEKLGMAGKDRAGFQEGQLGFGQGEADNWNGVSPSQVPCDSKGPSQIRAGIMLTIGKVRLERGRDEMDLTPFSRSCPGSILCEVPCVEGPGFKV